ncbi:hypothetical protein ACEE90_06970 [Corynebacterium phoceense]
MQHSIRKTLVAGATAVALTFAGTGFAAAEDDVTATESGSSDSFFAGSSDDDEEVSPGEIRDWISVFTFIIKELDSAMSFAS